MLIKPVILQITGFLNYIFWIDKISIWLDNKVEFVFITFDKSVVKYFLKSSANTVTICSLELLDWIAASKLAPLDIPTPNPNFLAKILDMLIASSSSIEIIFSIFYFCSDIFCFCL